MKLKFSALLGFLVLAEVAAQAQFDYTDNFGTITITGYRGSGGAVTIPAVTNGLPVTGIGPMAFYGQTVTSVTIPGSVTTIGELAFSECTSLTNVTISNGLANIVNAAFAYCPLLTSITIPGSVTNIGAYAFQYCSSLTNVTIGDSVTSIGRWAFYNCGNLTGAYFQGNAPTADSTVFAASNVSIGVSEDPVTVYYCPRTTGWGYTLAGLPIVLWTKPPTMFISTANNTIIDSSVSTSFSTSSSTVSLVGEASDNMGVVNVTWSNPQTGGSGAAIGTSLWAVTNIGLAAGHNLITVTAYDAAGYNNSITLNVLCTGSPGSLLVTIGPAAAITSGAKWQLDGGAWHNSGTTVSNLWGSNHTVSFNTVSGWTTPRNQTVSIKAKTVTKVTGKYSFIAQGIYNGLFSSTEGVTEERAGMLRSLDVTPSGTYTGKLLIGGGTYGISGGFNVSGQAKTNIPRSAALGGHLALDMTLQWSDPLPQITGTVSGTNGGSWVANLIANRTTNNGSAEYTILLLPAELGVAGLPPGDGCVSMTNHDGVCTLGGALADGTSLTAVSQTVPVDETGAVPVYDSLYGKTGLLLGWINLTNLDGAPSTNALTWIKKPSRATELYTNGFTNFLYPKGGLWVNPRVKTPAIELTNGTLVISNTGLFLTFKVAVSNNNALVKMPGSATNSLTGSITAKTGLFTITFKNGSGKETTGTGAVLQNVTNGGGFFLGKTNAGSIIVQP